VSETEADSKKSSGGRLIVYIVGAIVVLVVIYFAATSFQADQALPPEPVAEEPAPEPVAPIEGLGDVLSPEFNPFEF
jgi:hypothetical protein